jgi:hypothetical protein
MSTAASSDTETSLPYASTGLAIALNDRWSVTDDPLQWILQCRRGDQWHARSFCRTRSALQRCIREYCGPVDAVARLQIDALPDWHP